MEQVALQQDAEELLAGFNDVLGQHMERLLGFRLGPAGMPLNVVTLACLALLSEREDGGKGSVVEGRYTAEELLAELSDLGLREYGDCEDILRQLVEKDYVCPAGEGAIMPNPVALRLEELLERIFPKMPGLNFVAYVTQTMGEVKTGRKELALALSQFDQTLTMQGISVLRRKTATLSRDRPPLPLKDPYPPVSTPQTPSALWAIPEQEIAGQKVFAPSKTPGPKVLGSGTSSLQLEVHEFTMGEIGVDSEGAPEGPLDFSGAAECELDDPQPEEPPVPTEPIGPSSRTENGTEKGIVDQASRKDSPAGDPDDMAPLSVDRSEAEPDDDSSSDQEEPPIELDEKSIEQQILAFEEELSLWCPMCNKNRVEASTTPTGRTYYKCASRDCHFVSWGRPIHHPCPRCKNPFLIQVSDKSGRLAYKCPRATCQFYRLIGEGGAVAHATGAPLHRVARRRVVRRKR